MQATKTSTTSLDFPHAEKTPLPSGINVLTILTFIGCGIGLIFTALTPLLYKFSLQFMDKASTSPDISAKDLADIEQGRSAIELAQGSMIPLMGIGFISIILCLVGAIWMRKLKKDGYWLYIVGEILPVIGAFILLGTSQFTGVVSILMGVGIPLLFIFLYTMHRKFLVN